MGGYRILRTCPSTFACFFLVHAPHLGFRPARTGLKDDRFEFVLLITSLSEAYVDVFTARSEGSSLLAACGITTGGGTSALLSDPTTCKPKVWNTVAGYLCACAACADCANVEILLSAWAHLLCARKLGSIGACFRGT